MHSGEHGRVSERASERAGGTQAAGVAAAVVFVVVVVVSGETCQTHDAWNYRQTK
jgi:hypothetical protein